MTKRKRIFLVDDDVLSLKNGRAILQEKYTVTPVTSGSKLLEMLQSFHADIILLDIEMPGMDGYQVLEILKKNPKTSSIPVILLATKDDRDRQEGFLLGAAEYIRKPFSAQLLNKRIEHVLLLEEQKLKLQDYSTTVSSMETKHREIIEGMERDMLLWVADLIGYNSGTGNEDRQRMQFCIRTLLSEMYKSNLYQSEINGWNVGLDIITQSATLHDIGKIIVPNDLLRKMNTLEPDEFEEIQKHSVYGNLLIENMKLRLNNNKFLELAQTMAFLHHERWDGTGYPLGLKGNKIPLLARTVAVIDVYMALTSERVYKDSVSHEEALKTIEAGSGTQFDPDLVSLFLSISDKLI